MWQVSYVRACGVGFIGIIFVIRIISAFTNSFLAKNVANFPFLAWPSTREPNRGSSRSVDSSAAKAVVGVVANSTRDVGRL
jgi:hypothetical protein